MVVVSQYQRKCVPSNKNTTQSASVVAQPYEVKSPACGNSNAHKGLDNIQFSVTVKP